LNRRGINVTWAWNSEIAPDSLVEIWKEKEVRLCISGSTLAAVVTSNTATGSYNSAHDSYTSLGGMVLPVNMLLGELVFGGLGTGLYSMVMTAAVAVFLAGLMVGRTPEYLGNKNRAR
jgi:K+-transporting ATPase ATPase A chain